MGDGPLVECCAERATARRLRELAELADVHLRQLYAGSLVPLLQGLRDFLDDNAGPAMVVVVVLDDL
jgi:hypothetical protein